MCESMPEIDSLPEASQVGLLISLISKARFKLGNTQSKSLSTRYSKNIGAKVNNSSENHPSWQYL
jgi:hypothetical protein